MKSGRFKTEEFLLKYLISYILVLALPLCALFLFSYNQSIRMTRKNVLMTQENGMLQLQSLIDADVRKANDTIQEIRLNNVMQNFHIEQSGYNYYPAVGKLREYTSYNDLLTSLLYYEEGAPYIVSENGTIPQRYFGKNLYIWNSMRQEEVYEMLDGLKDTLSFQDTVKVPNKSSQKYMIYCIPLSGEQSNKEVILAFFNLNKMEEMITRSIDYKNVYLLITDQYGNVVWESGEKKTAGEKGGEEGVLFVRYSEETGWKYQGVIDIVGAAEEIEVLKGRYFGILLILLTLGSLVIYLFLRANYRPIQRLKNQVQELVDGLDIQSLNEVETIQQAVIALSDTLELETRKIKDVEPILEKYTLARALMGLSYEEEKLPNWLVEEKESRCYLIARISLTDQDELFRMNQLLNKIYASEFGGIILEPPFMPETVVVMYFESGQILRIMEILRELSEYCQKELKKTVNFYLSDPQHDIKFLENALFEASLTQNLSENREGTGLYLYSEQLTECKSAQDGWNELLHKMEMALLSRDPDALLAISVRFQEKECANISDRRKGDILIQLMEISSRNIDDPGTVRRLNHKVAQGLKELLWHSERRSLQEIVHEFCLDAVQFLLRPEEKEREGIRMELLLQYLDQYALDESFSLTAMAEAFQVSPSWLSNYFSKNMHTTLIGYVNHMKMDAAKEMLAHSDMDLEELTRKLGYGSASSFIRSFKNIVGMTPGRYRKIAGGKERKGEDANGRNQK